MQELIQIPKYPAEHAALTKAVDAAGGQTALASKLGRGVRQAKIWTWLNRDSRCGATYVLDIERVTGISRHELRPDIYPVELTGDAA